MNTYFSTNDLRNVNQGEYMFTQKEILRGEHEYYFIARSQFMRNISYYNEYDPLQRYRGNRIGKNTLVSFYTQYPRRMKDYFGDNFKIINQMQFSSEKNN